MFFLIRREKTNGVYSCVVQDSGAGKNVLRYPNLSYRVPTASTRRCLSLVKCLSPCQLMASNTIMPLTQGQCQLGPVIFLLRQPLTQLWERV